MDGCEIAISMMNTTIAICTAQSSLLDSRAGTVAASPKIKAKASEAEPAKVGRSRHAIRSRAFKLAVAMSVKRP